MQYTSIPHAKKLRIRIKTKKTTKTIKQNKRRTVSNKNVRNQITKKKLV